MAKRRKKTDKRKLIDRCEALWKEIVKRRDNFTCQHCGKTNLIGANCHASHVVPRSRSRRLAIDPINGKVLCHHCHLNWWHKHPVESGQWFRDSFPVRWEYLSDEERISETLTIVWYQDRLEELKQMARYE